MGQDQSMEWKKKKKKNNNNNNKRIERTECEQRTNQK